MFHIRGRSGQSWIQKSQNLALLVISYSLMILPAEAWELVSCHDGDTCRVSNDGEVYNLRFYGIDAPELDQPYGEKARDFLLSLSAGKTIDVEIRGRSFKRYTGNLLVDGQDASILMVKNGYAWDYPEFSKGQYAADEEYARKNKLGLWSTPDYVSPYCWRWMGVPKCVSSNNTFQP